MIPACDTDEAIFEQILLAKTGAHGMNGCYGDIDAAGLE